MAAKRKKQAVVEAPVMEVPSGASSLEQDVGFFNRVESNIKGGVNVPLTGCTAVVSDHNRAGKTAVLDSFRLGLTGTHPIGPHAADLSGLTADRSLPMVQLAGVTAASSLSWKGKTPVVTYSGALSTLTADDSKTLLPLVAMRDLLTLGTAKAREELFRRFGGKADGALRGLDENQQALAAKLMEATQGDVVEQLTAAGTWARSHKRNLSASIKSLEEERKRLADSPAVTDDVLRDLESRLAVVRAYAQGESIRTAHKNAVDGLLLGAAEYEHLQTPYTPEQLEEAKRAALSSALGGVSMDDLRAKVQAQEAAVETARADARLYTIVHRMRERLAADGCLVCGGVVHGDTQALITASKKLADDETARARAGEATLATLNDQLTAAQQQEAKIAADLERENMTREHKRQLLLERLRQRKAEYERLDQMLKSQGGAEAPTDTEADLVAQLEAAQREKVDRERLNEVAARLRALKTEQQDVKAVEAALADTLNRLVMTVKEQAEKAVNAWMPPNFKASLMLEDNDGKPACRWEIVGRDGTSHPRGAASGAEWSALTVAIACAWTEGQTYRFLLLDDADIAGFSASNLRALLNTVSAAVRDGRLTQALIAWSRPNEIPSEGWSVVAL